MSDDDATARANRAKAKASIEARVARLNEITRIAGYLSGPELEGLIVLATAAERERRALVGLDAARAAEAMAYILPPGEF